MVGIDQAGFDLDQVEDHLVCGCQTVVKDTLHHIMHARLELVVALKLRELNLEDKSAELLVY